MYARSKVLAITLVILLPVGFLATAPTATLADPMFCIALNDADAQGQSVSGFSIYENSTGSWVYYYGWNGTHATDADYAITDFMTLFNWTHGLGIKFLVGVKINMSYYGITTETEARNIIRLNLTVSTPTNASLYSKSNMTYNSKFTADYPIWRITYEDTLGFLPSQGNIYTVSVTYEVFF